MESGLKLREQDYKRYAKYVILIAIVFRMLYALKSIFCITDHDIGIIDVSTYELNGVGHLSYIDFLIRNKAFPAVDLNFTGFPPQFYHPPLFYIVGALIKSIVNSIGLSDVFSYEVIQQVNMIFSCVCLIACVKIIDEFKLSSSTRLLAISICAFNPIFTIIGIELNNDCLMTMFCLFALLYTIRWLKDSSWKNTMLIMVFLVLGMLSKTSAVLIAPAIGAAFLYRLVVSIKNKTEIMGLIRKFVVFGVTSIPLGLSWVIRNRILYDVPFNYVPSLPDDQWQYLGNYSPISRILSPSIKQMTSFSTDFADPDNFKNIWGQMLQSMTFDEGILYNPNPILPMVLLWSIAALYLVLLYSFIRYLISKENLAEKLVLGLAHIVLLIMFIAFAYQYPHICTVHYRYIVVAFVVMAIGATKFIEKKNILKRITGILTAISAISFVFAYLLY